MPGKEYWDQRIHQIGHTSYAETFKRRYDRPLRLRAIRRQLAAMRAFTEQGGRALDFGCGEGDIVGLLRKEGWAVLGSDISPNVLRVARQRFSDDPGVEFVETGPADMPTGIGEFQLCTIIDVLQNIPDDDMVIALLSEIRARILANGRVITLEIATPSKMLTFRGRMRERTPNQWRAIYRKAGFEIEKETMYAPWGMVLVQQFDRLIGRVLSWRARRVSKVGMRRARPPETGESTVGRRKFLRSKRNLAANCVRRTILITAWPLDYLFRIPGPRWWAFHRFFVLKVAD